MSNIYWEHDGQRITLDDIRRFISWHKISPTPILIESLEPLLTVKTSPERVRSVDSTDPIMVNTHNRRPIILLDGHHRVQQAKRRGDTKIAAYTMERMQIPVAWRNVFSTS